MYTSPQGLKDAFTFNVATWPAASPVGARACRWRQRHQHHLGRRPARGPRLRAYGTAKAALAHYTKLAAMDLCPKIRVNGIAPGSILTSALDIVASNEALRDPMEKGHADAPPRPRTSAPPPLYLASPAGAYVTGKVLEVDGGLTFPNLDLRIPDLHRGTSTCPSKSPPSLRQQGAYALTQLIDDPDYEP